MREATVQDMEAIRLLLEAEELPTQDLSTSHPVFIVHYDGSLLVAAGALQRCGDVALLRSVAVTATHRGRGFGRAIVSELERTAAQSRITALILLTLTARHFFEQRGYRVIDRNEVPPAIRASAEFQSLCPATATCMSKAIA